MDKIYSINKVKIDRALKEIWYYMKLNQVLEKCDLIIGCGCANLDIPVKCSSLYKNGYAPKILFAGGLGKITKNKFNKSEAEIYRDIAIANGVREEDILVETESTNTGDNFRFAMKILDESNIKYNKVLIVHKPLSERRTYSSARMILKDRELIITSFDMTFDEYLEILNKKSEWDIINEISVIVGDIQRLIIYPQFGWQIENFVPDAIIKNYYYLKSLGFSKYVVPDYEIKKLINKYGIIIGGERNYF